MAAGAIRLPELRQDIKVNTNDLTRARAAAAQFKRAMERDLNVSTTQAGRNLDGLVKKLDKMKESTAEIRREMEKIRDVAKDIKIDLQVDQASLQRAREQIESAVDNQTVRINVEVDDPSLEAAKAKIDAAFSDETVDVKVNVDTSQLDQAKAAIADLRNSMGSSFNIDTSQWQNKMEEVRNTLQAIKKDTDQLYESAILLGASFKAARKAAEQLKEELIALQAVAAKDIKIQVDVDDDSVARAKAIIDAAFNNDRIKLQVDVDPDSLAAARAVIAGALSDERVTVTVDVDTSALSTAQQEVAAFKRSIEGSFNVDTSKWQDQMNEVQSTLAVLREQSGTLRESQSELGLAFRTTRQAAEALKAELIELRLAAGDIKMRVEIDKDSLATARAMLNLAFGDETVKVFTEIDNDSLMEARALIQATLGDETVKVKIDVDTSSLDGASRKIQGLSRALQNALNIDTSRWMQQVDEVINALDDLGDATQELLADQKDLGAHMRETRQEMSMMASAANGIDLALDGVFNRLDDMMRIDLSHLGGQLRGIKQDLNGIDWSGAAGDIQRFSAGVAQAFNIDTSRWKEQVQEAKDVLHELHQESDDTEGSAHRLGAAMREQRNEIETDDSRWQDLLETLTRIEGKFGELGDKIGEVTRITRSFAVQTTDSLAKNERQFLAVERAHGRVAQAARDLASATGSLQQAMDGQAAASARLAAAELAVQRAQEEVTRREADLIFQRGMGISTTEEMERAEEELSLARQQLHLATGSLKNSEAELTAEKTRHTVATMDAASATKNLERAQLDLGKAGRDVTNDQQRVASSFDNTSGSGVRLHTVLRNLKAAFIGLSVVGLIVPGIGVLGGALVGLAAAASDLLPAVLLLPAAFTSVGVAALGLFAIFKNNKGLEEPIKKLGEAFKGIAVDLQNQVNPSIVAFLAKVREIAPIVRQLAPEFGKVFIEIANSFTSYIGSQGFLGDLRTILAGSIVQFQDWGMTVRAGFEAFVGLAAEGQGMMSRISDVVRRNTEEFRDWVNEARRTGELNRMFERMGDIFESLITVVSNLVSGFKNLFQIADMSGFTDQVLQALNDISANFESFTAQNEAKLTAMFDNLGRQVMLLVPLFASVADGIRIILTNVDLTPLVQAVQEVMTNFAEGASEAANAIGRLAKEAAPAINSILTLVRNLIPDVERIGTAFLNNVKPAIDAIAPGIERFGDMLATVAENVMPPLLGFFRNLGDIISGLVAVFAPVVEAISSVVGLLGNLSGAMGLLVTAILKVAIAKAIFGDLGRVITGAAEPTTRLQRAVDGVSAPVRNLSGDVKTLGESMDAQRTRAEALGQSMTRTQAAARAMQEGQSGLTRALGESLGAFDSARTKTAAYVEQALTGANRTRSFGEAATAAGSAITGAFSSSLTSARGLFTSLGEAMGNARSRVTEWASSAVQAATSAQGLARGAGQAAGAFTGVFAAGINVGKQALTGLMDAMGGPWGVAIAAVLTALGAWAQHTAEVKQQQQQLKGALEQSGGAIDENVRKTIQATLESSNLADGAEALGVSQTQLASAVSGTQQEFDSMIQRLQEASGGSQETTEDFGALGEMSNELGANLNISQDAIAELIDVMKRERAEMLIQQQLLRERNADETARQNSMTATARSTEAVTRGFQAMNQAAGDSKKSIDGLTQALDGMSGTVPALDQATRDYGEALRNAGQSATEFSGQATILNGDLDEGTAAGAAMFDAMDKLRDGMLTEAQAAFQAAGGTNNLQEATAKANEVLQRHRGELLNVARQFTNNEAEAQKYVDKLLAVPNDVLTRILADPANAQKTYEDWKRGVPLAPPGPAPITANTQPARDLVKEFLDQTRNADPTPAPFGGNVDPLHRDVGQAQTDVQRGPETPAPFGANVDPLRQQIGAERDRIQGGERWMIPMAVNLQQFQTELGAERVRIESGEAWRIPLATNFDRDFTPQFTAKMNEIINGAAWLIPMGVNWDRDFTPQFTAKMGEIANGAGWLIPMATNFDRDFTPQFQAKYNEIVNGSPWPIPMSINWDTYFTPQFQAKYNEIVNGAPWPIPMSINWDTYFTPQFQAKMGEIVGGAPWPIPTSMNPDQFVQMYDALQTAVTTPVWPIKVALQLVGIGMGSGGIAAAAGGIVANETGNIVEAVGKEARKSMKKFATGGFNWGMSKADHEKLKRSMGNSVQQFAGGGTNPIAQAGLTPMNANRAQIVAPNTWRVIGDRAQDDEAYIPINKSARSMAILATTMERMGVQAERMANGGFSPTSSATNTANGDGKSTNSHSQVINNQSDAPMINGDLVITVPSETPVQDSMDEVLFQLRRIKRGGVHVRSAMRSK